MLSRAGFAAALLACTTFHVNAINFNANLSNVAAPATLPLTTPTTHTTSIVSSNSSTVTSSNTTTSGNISSSKDPDKWTMPTVVSLQARVVSDPPVWDQQNQRYTGSFGTTAEEKYVGVFDTVNTASIEGALLYVQAEGINQPEQSVKCQRKNNMRHIIFYQVVYAQPPESIAWYDAHIQPMVPPEYCPYVAMDGGKCTMEGDHLPVACQQYDGQGGQPKLGMCVGAGAKESDPRAPYPDAYWFSFPNSCPFTSWKEKKTSACRQEYPGGLCPQGTVPDGKNCTYSYEILGYLPIDALVGITSEINGTTFSNFTEFCQAGKVEFSAVNDGAHGFTNVTSDLTFWSQPGDPDANRNRTEYMVQLYNKNTQSTSLLTTGQMQPLMTVDALTKKNPPCYKTTSQCAKAVNGCRRVLYSQLCQVCETAADGCIKAPQGFTFPKLEIPKSNVSTTGSQSSIGSGSSSSYVDTSISTPQVDGKKKKTSKQKANSANTIMSSATAVLVTGLLSMLF